MCAIRPDISAGPMLRSSKPLNVLFDQGDLALSFSSALSGIAKNSNAAVRLAKMRASH